MNIAPFLPPFFTKKSPETTGDSVKLITIYIYLKKLTVVIIFKLKH
nr:MAG TPA: hypothetical protein [Caudoviricetes sp.]